MTDEQTGSGHYLASIKVLTGVESVRMRPAMYFGGVGPDGATKLLQEVIANAADQFLAGEATSCRIDCREADEGVEWIVEDDGAGMPFDVEEGGIPLVVHYLTSLHFTPTRDDHAPHVHVGGLHGVGLGAVAAVCRRFEVQSWRSGSLWRLVVREGVVHEGPTVLEVGSGRGTVVRLVLDPAIFDSALPERVRLRAALFEASHLMAGWQVSFGEEVFHAVDGLKSLLPLHAPPTSTVRKTRSVHHAWENQRMRVEVAACGDAGRGATVWRSWVNCGGTLGGSHVEGVRRAFEEMDWVPGAVLVHVLFQEPAFAGPTKEWLEVPWVEEDLVRDLLPRLRDADSG